MEVEGVICGWGFIVFFCGLVKWEDFGGVGFILGFGEFG